MTVTTQQQRAEEFATAFSTITTAINSVVRGKPELVRNMVVTLLSRGHVLVEDIPGVGKTTLAVAMGQAIGGTVRRVQFTPDLLPASITGSSVWNQRDSTFDFHEGPLFANVVIADELNRATPQVQSALLEAMAERQVSVEGDTRQLAEPHFVIATQNPFEHYGTSPLPESQLDRFLMALTVGYPSRTAESDILAMNGTDNALAAMHVATSPDYVNLMSKFCETIHVSDLLRDYILDIVEKSRNHPEIETGLSTRGAIGLQRAARCVAAADAREFVQPHDVQNVALNVIAHRLIMKRTAMSTLANQREVCADIMATVSVPNGL